MIGFTTELSKQLKEARKGIELDPETQLTRDQWMILSDIGPSINNDENEEVDDVNPDTTHDFLSHRQNNTKEVLKIFEGNYIKNEKKKLTKMMMIILMVYQI
ncbi:hypothetical protein BpHYR1_046993 [Brachionus plicatilis]|uniref:Uncharacterized protein n=1 Tax=Brachionus plicatilis TaxID=10195 RepID=A0A3M7SDE6_BRAPC|nr:hypothetical protein BpHYR1_046993 [Brachionus plicatilis]